MNIAAGIFIGVVSKTWLFCLLLPFLWGFVHCAYGFVFRMHDNPVVAGTKAGNPIVSYYIARFFTGTITSLIFSAIAFSVLKYLF